jgi:hypothetical protein
LPHLWFTPFNETVVPDAIILLILNDYRGAIKVCKIAAVNKVISLSGRTAFSFSRKTKPRDQRTGV